MTKEEILPGVIDYFNGDSMAANVWIDKYCMKTKEGDLLERTPDDMHKRIAKEFARIELKYPDPISEETIYQLLKGFKYIVPQGSPMSGIGNPHLKTSLSNCFVIGDNEAADSYGGIMRTDEEQVQIMKRRGGVGHDLSHLRPSGAMANNAALTDLAGSVLYAQRFSNSTQEVRQGDRRGALMLSMSIKHPDAQRFIDSKLESGKITDANISVRITDDFMEAVNTDGDFIQTFPIGFNYSNIETLNLEYDKLVECDENGNIGYVKKIKAKKLWNKIIHNAWKSAEPGILFWDTIIKESVADCYADLGFKTLSTNPCGEIPLSAYDACRLLLINLYSYVLNPFSTNATFNYEKFKEDTFIAQRLMDDIVDLEVEKITSIINKISVDPEPYNIKFVEIELWIKLLENTKNGRRTGLGITGEGDMLAAMGLRYGSEEAIDFSVNVHKLLAIQSYSSSIKMAASRGNFKDWDSKREINNPFIDRILGELKDTQYQYLYDNYGRRNISNLTISPAGSVSILTQTTSGIEPCFAVYYKRRRRTVDKNKAVFIDPNGEMFEEYFVFHHKFVEWYDLNWFRFNGVRAFDIDYKKDLDSYNQVDLDLLISKSPYYKATSIDIDWKAKVEMQGAIQKWVDHSISATTNIPEDTSVEVVSDIYTTAYESGCKGMTIYREGSRSGILITDKKDKFKYVDAVKRSKELECDIHHKTALKKNWMILVGKFEGKPYEIFAFPEVQNHIFPTKIEIGTLTKVKSRTYKLVGKDNEGKHYEIPNVIELLDDNAQVSTRKYSMMLRHMIDPKWIIKEIQEYALVSSFDKVIQRVLRSYVEEPAGKCEECGGELKNENGCVTCTSCGWSKCS